MIVSIEGNIGSGKSTFIHLLKKYCSQLNELDIIFIQEPVSEWLAMTDTDGKNILEKFYSDQSRWSYSFQMIAFITRAKKILEHYSNKNTNKIIILERSVETDRKIFATLLKESGKISAMEWKLYDQWYEWLTNEFPIIPDKYIYLQAKYEVSFERMKKRCRKEEDIVPIEYIKSLCEKHDQWLLGEKDTLIVDVDKEFENDLNYQQILFEKVLKFIV
jgi:deoxyadenosine/deoxycytidine kinase